MGNRYWITGVQLGMLLAFAKDGGMYNEAMETGEEVMKQDLEMNVKSFTLWYVAGALSIILLVFVVIALAGAN